MCSNLVNNKIIDFPQRRACEASETNKENQLKGTTTENWILAHLSMQHFLPADAHLSGKWGRKTGCAKSACHKNECAQMKLMMSFIMHIMMKLMLMAMLMRSCWYPGMGIGISCFCPCCCRCCLCCCCCCHCVVDKWNLNVNNAWGPLMQRTIR